MPKGHPNRFRNGREKGLQTDRQTYIFVFIIVEMESILETLRVLDIKCSVIYSFRSCNPIKNYTDIFGS